MKKSILLAFAISLFGCNDQKTFVPDGTTQLNQEMNLRDEIQSAQNDLFSARLDGLEKRVSDLETRLTTVEQSIDSMSGQITTIFDDIDGLQGADASLRQQISDTAAQLRAADEQARLTLVHKFRTLSRQLADVVRAQGLADAALQSQIDSLNDALDLAEARQQTINRLLAFGLFLANGEISMLQARLSELIQEVHDNFAQVQVELTDIRGRITSIQNNIVSVGNELDAIKDKLVSVVHPCGDANEALLQTQDGLVGIFSFGRNQQLTFTDTDTDTIPEHAVCSHTMSPPGNGPGGNDNGNSVCSQISSVPASTATQSSTVTFFSLDRVQLLSIPDGAYTTADGWSCNFSVANGQVAGN